MKLKTIGEYKVWKNLFNTPVIQEKRNKILEGFLQIHAYRIMLSQAILLANIEPKVFSQIDTARFYSSTISNSSTIKFALSTYAVLNSIAYDKNVTDITSEDPDAIKQTIFEAIESLTEFKGWGRVSNTLSKDPEKLLKHRKGLTSSMIGIAQQSGVYKPLSIINIKSPKNKDILNLDITDIKQLGEAVISEQNYPDILTDNTELIWCLVRPFIEKLGKEDVLLKFNDTWNPKNTENMYGKIEQDINNAPEVSVEIKRYLLTDQPDEICNETVKSLLGEFAKPKRK